MEHNIEYRGDYFYIELIGEPDSLGMSLYIKELVEHPNWVKNGKTLTDYTRCDIDLLKDENRLKVFASILKSYKDQLGYVSDATVMNSDSIDKFVTIFHNMLIVSRLKLNLKIFTNINDAIKWLNEIEDPNITVEEN